MYVSAMVADIGVDCDRLGLLGSNCVSYCDVGDSGLGMVILCKLEHVV